MLEYENDQWTETINWNKTDKDRWLLSSTVVCQALKPTQSTTTVKPSYV